MKSSSSGSKEGTVVAYLRHKCFGYIEDTKTKINHWFHVCDVASRKTPTVGQRVTFELGLDPKGREKATNIVELETATGQLGGGA